MPVGPGVAPISLRPTLRRRGRAEDILDQPGHPRCGLEELVDVDPLGERAAVGMAELRGDDGWPSGAGAGAGVVGRDDDAGGGDHGVGQSQLAARSGVGEQPLPLSQDQRMDEDEVLVDEVLLGEPADQLAAAQDRDRAIGSVPQGRDRGGQVTGEQGGVLPREGSLAVDEATYFGVWLSTSV
jgi:hypothetical protein